ncbi:MBL fold metallo-hydrolase [Aurantibacter crassamenti]|nr:MBL fold metallo-hydrolase [Aurantibacter crassamenti]
MILSVIATIIGIVVLVAIIFIYTSPEFGAKSKGTVKEIIEKSENFKGGKFQNVYETAVATKTDWGAMLGFFTNGNKVPDWSIPVEKLPKDYFKNVPDSLTRLTWFGHSALLLEIDGKKIFLDPMLGSVPSPHPMLGSKRFNDTLPMAIDDLPNIDAVLISHDHYDHLDYGSIKNLDSKVAHFYVPLGLGAHLTSWGVAAEKITEMDWWQQVDFFGITLVSTPARHFSGRGLTDRFSTLWCSWVIKGSTNNIFFGGDSGYDASFSEIGNKYGPFDFAMLECGQYDEQWAEIHMMPEETVQASIDLKSEILMPIHWGAFKLGLHPWQEPAERVSKKAAELNVQLATPKIGEPIVLGETIPASSWWIKK